MLKASLYLSIYHPIWGTCAHWASKVKVGSTDTYYLQIFGEPGTFAFNETRGNDPVIAPHRKDINIWNLESIADVERVRNVARKMRIDTETVLWNCQDWCMDVIQELEEDLVVGTEEDGDEKDLAEWKRLKRSLVKEMGPSLFSCQSSTFLRCSDGVLNVKQNAASFGCQCGENDRGRVRKQLEDAKQTL